MIININGMVRLRNMDRSLDVVWIGPGQSGPHVGKHTGQFVLISNTT